MNSTDETLMTEHVLAVIKNLKSRKESELTDKLELATLLLKKVHSLQNEISAFLKEGAIPLRPEPTIKQLYGKITYTAQKCLIRMNQFTEDMPISEIEKLQDSELLCIKGLGGSTLRNIREAIKVLKHENGRY